MADSAGNSTGGGGRPGGSDGGGSHDDATARTEPGPGDIFSLPETLSQIKETALSYVVLAIGYAVIAAGIGTFGGSGAGGMAVGAMALISLVMVVLAPILAVFHGYRHADIFSELPDDVVYATTAVANAMGVVALFVVATIFAFAAAPPAMDVGGAIGESVVPLIVVMFGVGIISAGTVWTTRRLTPGSGAAVDAEDRNAQPARE
jgi:hypothetical protein